LGNLAELTLDISYRSDEGSVVADFYVPCLERSTVYRRAAGYFSSHGLALAARGLAHLIKSGGRIQLVVSPQLSADDVEAIQQGYKSREEVLEEAARRALTDPETELSRNRLSALAWMIATGTLDIKIALRADPITGRLSRGIYHEKIGIFSDNAGNHVAFTGSGNETEGGLLANFESIDVYCSWRDPDGRVARKIAAFERLWHDSTAGLIVLDFNRISKDLLAKFKGESPPEFDLESVAATIPNRAAAGRPRRPTTIALREYQDEAVRSWFKNNGTGILEMATGTGKTITALAACTRLADQIGLQAVIIVCPYRHLVTQWSKECLRFRMQPLLAFESRARWYEELTARLSDLSRDTSAFFCVVVTNSTFASESFQQRLRYFPSKTMLIADEVHNLGAARLATALPENVRLRLGLSATPERWLDPEGTERLRSYFGKVIEPRLGIREAIQLGALVPYRYYPILVDLTDEERAGYLDLSAKISRFYGVDEANPDNPILTALLLKRARLIGTAANKLKALRQLGESHRHAGQMLFYCGDGQVESDVDESIRRQVEEVTRVLGNELGIKVAPYTANTDVDERSTLREDLEAERLQGLVAIRCLDEGVDIPSVRTAVILASSTNPRQFVQRRGRVLRRCEGKEHAEIYDMIVVPPIEAKNSASERSLLRKELTRFAEFADIALNAGEARKVVFDLQKAFNLMDI
jgi:DNA phosphorothioation system restriction enzyme